MVVCCVQIKTRAWLSHMSPKVCGGVGRALGVHVCSYRAAAVYLHCVALAPQKSTSATCPSNEMQTCTPAGHVHSHYTHPSVPHTAPLHLGSQACSFLALVVYPLLILNLDKIPKYPIPQQKARTGASESLCLSCPWTTAGP